MINVTASTINAMLLTNMLTQHDDDDGGDSRQCCCSNDPCKQYTLPQEFRHILGHEAAVQEVADVDGESHRVIILYRGLLNAGSPGGRPSD